jgi:hypothetical protein
VLHPRSGEVGGEEARKPIQPLSPSGVFPLGGFADNPSVPAHQNYKPANSERGKINDEAEGVRQAKILAAEGEAQAIKLLLPRLSRGRWLSVGGDPSEQEQNTKLGRSHVGRRPAAHVKSQYPYWLLASSVLM